MRASTESDERINNRFFSAPEQAKTGIPAHPTMDIYAIGQIMQWFITGATHQGTGRRRFASVLPAIEYLDGIVDRCLNFDPKDRFQNVPEIRKALEATKQRTFSKVMEEYAIVCASTVPKGLNTMVHITQPDELNRLLNGLLLADQLNEHEDLWTIREHCSFPASIRQVNGVWLLGPYEIQLRDAWIYHNLSEYNDIICVTLEGMPPFGLYKREGGGTPSTEEAGLVDGRTYVTRAEHDNNWAEIDGKAVSLSGGRSELRCRYLSPHSFVVTTRFHCAFQVKNEQSVENMMKRMEAGETLDRQEVLEWVREMSKHKHPDVELHL